MAKYLLFIRLRWTVSDAQHVRLKKKERSQKKKKKESETDSAFSKTQTG